MLTDNLYAGRTMKYHADLEQKIKEQTPETRSAVAEEVLRSQAAGGRRGRHAGRGGEVRVARGYRRQAIGYRFMMSL